MSELSNKHEGGKVSPLLRLPGELRNKIYDFLTIDDDVDFTLNTSNLIVSLHKYKVFTQVSRQLRKELHSYILYHGVFHIEYEDLDRFDRSFANEKMLRISNLALDITDASSNIDAAPPTAKKLTPLCKEGRLRRIITKGVYGCWKIKKWSGAYCARTMDVVEDLSVLMNFESIGHDVTVKKGKETSTERQMRLDHERFSGLMLYKWIHRII